jgi:glycosyltransferase involved in cell wall biosynthesis
VDTTYSLIVPVYRNEDSIRELIEAISQIDVSLGGGLEAVLVVDGSPDRSYERLLEGLPSASFRSRLLLLSRNFGSFAAIRAGLRAATGRYFAVMAADLQEPPQLIVDFFSALRGGQVDVTLGVRTRRGDPWTSRLASNGFWWLYRRFVQREIPSGGIDVFGCNEAFRAHLLALDEANTSLVGQIVWLGFRRAPIRYERVPRRHDRSAWTVERKLTYLMDSLLSFSDFPIRVLIASGLLGVFLSTTVTLVVVFARLTGAIEIPGYTATIVTITFFAALNTLGLGIIGSYTWRAYENTKRRPEAVVQSACVFEPERSS